MKCILKSCAHDKTNNCRSLGSCGAEYALSKARDPHGYAVLLKGNNPTVRALSRARLVTVQSNENGDRIFAA